MIPLLRQLTPTCWIDAGGKFAIAKLEVPENTFVILNRECKVLYTADSFQKCFDYLVVLL